MSLQTAAIPQFPPPWPTFLRQPVRIFLPTLDVRAGDSRRARGGAAGQNVSILLNVDDSGTGNTDSARSGCGRGSSESNLAEVGKLNLGAALLKVLNNPLGVGLAEGTQ